MRFGVVIERDERNCSAYVPDLPGCGVTGATVVDVEREIRIAIRFHLDGLRTHGKPLPELTSIVEYAEA
jgi:predicted RNase H-like HicB family nuclease